MDVNLTITPINPTPTPDFSVTSPLELRVMASDASIPPTIIGEDGTPQGIELIFSEPLDPVQASHVKNYAVHVDVEHTHGENDPLALFSPLASTTVTPMLVPLKSAQYNAATNTVTLIPRGHLTYDSQILVTQRLPAHAAGRANAGTGAAQGLVDLQGGPIDQTATPGKFLVSVARGYTDISSGLSAYNGLLKRGLHAYTFHYSTGDF